MMFHLKSAKKPHKNSMSLSPMILLPRLKTLPIMTDSNPLMAVWKTALTLGYLNTAAPQYEITKEQKNTAIDVIKSTTTLETIKEVISVQKETVKLN
ncbi:hypothetical protein Glove_256g170 [Diversispora epigaea]|uniref:Uncharacterized protein n=1 Tax=Diversispora epigaea TaxID=1348612 RepID=A0A397I9U1_9GLOM|nr:hypothetical protein Glove_256g170 [Diversispora epigaea]